jgi:putative hemolysin
LRAFLTQQEVVYRFHEKDAARIPKSGPFIMACNHPLGALDGLILLEIIQTVRPDVKIMGHQLLERIQPLQPYLLPVNPMEGRSAAPSASLRGLRGALDWLANGHAVVVFPAAEVSRFQWETQKIEDRPYPDGVLRFLEKANVPVLPAHFFGRNSWGFYLASALLRPLSTGLLVREALRPARKPYEIRLGKPFTFENGPNLRQRIYRLQQSKRYLKTLWQTVFLPPKTQDPVAPLPDPAELASAVQRHLSRVAPLVAQSNLVVFVAHGDGIPGLLETVGSLRETAFRGVGEGTGLPLDVDRFDATYHHLILWNTELKCIWGAYRLGLGHALLAQYGKQGLYLHAFYRIKKELLPFLHQTVEMGRSSFLIR